MYISLTPHLEELLQNKVLSGLYKSNSDVIREALRLLEIRDHLRELQLEELKSKIQKEMQIVEENPFAMKKIKTRGRPRLAAQQDAKMKF